MPGSSRTAVPAGSRLLFVTTGPGGPFRCRSRAAIGIRSSTRSAWSPSAGDGPCFPRVPRTGAFQHRLEMCHQRSTNTRSCAYRRLLGSDAQDVAIHYTTVITIVSTKTTKKSRFSSWHPLISGAGAALRRLREPTTCVEPGVTNRTVALAVWRTGPRDAAGHDGSRVRWGHRSRFGSND